LNCASICHEDHILGPVTRDSFYCRCFENDVHYCRASRAAQCHIIRRRTQDAKFKALQQQYLRDRTAYPSSASLLSNNTSGNYSNQNRKSKDKKFVVWYRIDDQPKAIVKMLDDIDDANECVKEGFVEYNPWNLSGLELRSLETFQCSFSATGLAFYSVSLIKPSAEVQQHVSAANGETVELRHSKSVSLIDLAKAGTSDVTVDNSEAVNGASTNAHSTEEYLVEDGTLIERGRRWEVHAELLDVFLLEYGWEPAPVMPSITPAQHRPVDWYEFPEGDPFIEQETADFSNGKKHSKNVKKKTVHVASTQGKKKHGRDYQPAEEMTDDVNLPIKKGSQSGVGKRKYVSRHITSSGRVSRKVEYADDWEDLRPTRKRGRSAAAAVSSEHRYGSVTLSSARKPRISKEEGAPKGPSSCFMFFSNKLRASVREQFPDMSVTDVPRYIGEQWHKMSAAEKEPFEEMARQDRVRYAREKAAFEEAKQGKTSGLLSPELFHDRDDTNELIGTSDILEDEKMHLGHQELALEMNNDSNESREANESFEHEEQEIDSDDGEEAETMDIPDEAEEDDDEAADELAEQDDGRNVN
jgi:hypothetical protein